MIRLSSFFHRSPLMVLVLMIIVGIAGLLAFDFTHDPLRALEKQTVDPYVLSTRGKTLVLRSKVTTLSEGEKLDLESGDRVKTLADSSATIFWPDGSVTRLGAKSTLTITKLQVASDLSDIRIECVLENGRSWSNVIHYLSDDSSFQEGVGSEQNIIATVRGTVFEANVEAGYLHTVDHAVSIEDRKSGKTSLVSEGGIASLADIAKRLDPQTLDQAWIALNRSEDLTYLTERMNEFKKQASELLTRENWTDQLHSYIDQTLSKNSLAPEMVARIITGSGISETELRNEIAKLRDPKEANQTLLQAYQMVNSFPDTGSNLRTKLLLRDALISSAPSDREKQRYLDDFARYTLFETWKTAESKSTEELGMLQEKLNSYVASGASMETLKTLESSLSGENAKAIQTTLDELRANGASFGKNFLEIFGKEDYSKTLQQNLQNIDLQKIEEFNNSVDQVKNQAKDWLLRGAK